MASEQNILIKVTGEADLTDAQLQLREMTNRSKELEKQMAELDAQQRQDANDLKASIQGEKELSNALKQKAQYYGNLKGKVQEAINANTKSISTLKQQVSAMNAVNNSGGKLAMQVKAIREQLAQMEMAGDTSSQAFIDLSVQAAKLQDQIGDTSQQIAILSSDTKNLDAAMSVGQGIAGAFNVATAAAALFGGESEELNQAFLKVQASLAVLNGVQQVANTLNKDSAANVVIRTALQKLFNREKAKETVATTAAATASTADTAAKGAQTVATTAATKATWSFTAALLANPVMLIVAGVAALAAGVYALVKAFDKSAQAERAAAKATEAYDKQNKITTLNLQRLANAHQNTFNTIEKNEKQEIANAERNHASKISMLNTELKYQKQKKDELVSYTAKALEQNNKEQIAANKMVEAKRRQLEAQKEGSDDYYKVLEELTDAENKMHSIYQRGSDLIAERDNALQQVSDTERAIADERIAIQDRVNKLKIELMDEGRDKEVAAIKQSYKEQLREVGKGTQEHKLLTEKMNKELEEINKQHRQREQDALVEALRLESESDVNNLDLKQLYYETDAQNKIASLDKSKMSEEEYANAVEAIRLELNNRLKDIGKQRVDNARQDVVDELNAERYAAEEVLASSKSTNSEKRAAIIALKDIRNQELQNEMDANKAMYDQGIITYKEYQRRLQELNHERVMNEIADEEEKMTQMRELTNETMQFISDLGNEIFGMISDGIQQQLDDLDNMYTTDAEEAKEDASKKYMTEKELNDKKLELKRKQAVADKAAAAFNIGMNTAIAIMRIWADVPKVDFGATTIALTAMVAALGAVQLAAVLAKPLPQYAKGRAGGKGEYALVGERGPELMYVPEGASIVPNSKLSMPKEWVNYGLPRQPHFMGPTMDDTARTTMAMQLGLMAIDYDRLGKAVADNIPAQKAVSVNVDRRGITIDDGTDQHTYLNKKYTGQWT